jgi:ribonuclease HI
MSLEISRQDSQMSQVLPIRDAIAQTLERHDLANVVRVWFDGACEPKNPGGIATCGWLIRNSVEELISSGHREVARGEGATNNVAEWTALGLALRWLLDNPEVVSGNVLHIQGDSQLVIEQLNGTWNCNKPHLQKLRDRCREILDQLGCVAWRANWIPRLENQEADALSRRAYEEATGKSFPKRGRR